MTPGASIPMGKTSEILDAEQAVESIAFMSWMCLVSSNAPS